VKLAIRSRLTNYDPCLGVKLPEVRRREMSFLCPTQINDLADELERAWPGQGWGTLVRFAAYTGLRAGEIGGLRVKHLDLLRRRVHVTGARKTYGADGDTKTKKSRWVDLPHQLCDELAAHLAARDHNPEARVWTGDRGGPLDHKWFYKCRFKPVVERLSGHGRLPVLTQADGSTKTLRFHDLRHTCVALLIAKGAQQYEVMEHLGHTNIQTTINTYGHLFPSVRDRIRTALEDTWAEAADVAS
ncbi:MAG: site-specific integrase, partial [Acidimicrobiia bacterium]|nr:site-specific integrase [Acidimicrobiia bacterium]